MSTSTEANSRSIVSVLVVDDDPDIRYTLQDVLEAEGYAVATAANGADALAQLQTLTPEMILLDLSMPVMSGEEFRRAQVEDPALASIPTVVVTASGRMKEIVSSMGVEAHLAKPLELDDVLQVVARYASR